MNALGQFIVGSVAILTAAEVTSSATTTAPLPRPSGIWVLSTPGNTGNDLFTNPIVHGVTIRANWKDVEPTEGGFAWGYIDSQVQLAKASGRPVQINVTPGAYSPDWIYKKGAVKLSFTWSQPYVYEQCSEQAMPLPWDGVYLSAWLDFIKEMGLRYAANDTVIGVKITGVNYTTGEIMVPFNQPGPTDCTGYVPPQMSVSMWQGLGYTPVKVENAWQKIVGAWSAYFPRQELIMQTGPWSYPPLNNQGKPTGAGNDTTLGPALMSTCSVSTRNCILQDNGGNAVWSWKPPVKTSAVAAQAAGIITGDSNCRMNHFAHPCPPVAVLTGALAKAKAAGVQFYEFYAPDVRNLLLQSIFQKGV